MRVVSLRLSDKNTLVTTVTVFAMHERDDAHSRNKRSVEKPMTTNTLRSRNKELSVVRLIDQLSFRLTLNETVKCECHKKIFFHSAHSVRNSLTFSSEFASKYIYIYIHIMFIL